MREGETVNSHIDPVGVGQIKPLQPRAPRWRVVKYLDTLSVNGKFATTHAGSESVYFYLGAADISLSLTIQKGEICSRTGRS